MKTSPFNSNRQVLNFVAKFGNLNPNCHQFHLCRVKFCRTKKKLEGSDTNYTVSEEGRSNFV